MPAAESRDLARELGASFARMVQGYREEYGFSAPAGIQTMASLIFFSHCS
jgi:hypothetical protein